MNGPTAGRAAAVILNTVGTVLLVVGIGLGLSAAGQFRAAIQFGTSTCVTGETHSSVPPVTAWVAIVVQCIGLLCAIVCVVVELRSSRTRPVRPFALVVGITLATTGLIATLLSGYLIHEIGTCAALLST
jgi:hypothetical protein